MISRLSLQGERDESQQNASANRCMCQVCGGVGRLRIEAPYGHPSFGKSTLCSCAQARQTALHAHQRRHVANMDALHQSTFQAFNSHLPGVGQAYRVSTLFAVKPHGWLLLVGPYGCGKTHLAAAIANYRLEHGATVYFATVPDLLDALRAACVSTEHSTQFFARMSEVDLLVLDDLGVQQPTAWSHEKLAQLLTYRASAVLPTVITAVPKELQGLDERLRSHMTDAHLVITVLFNQASDYRLSKRRGEVKERT